MGRPFIAGFALAGALLAIAAPETVAASAAPAARSELPQQVWVTDGTVSALTATSRGVFAGGDFSLIGPETGTWVQASAAGGVLPVAAQVEGQVRAAVADGRGGWYLAGISSVGGVARQGLVHLLSTGRLDKRWKPRVKGSVSALARIRSTLYLGGDFTRFAGKTRLRLAAVDVKTGALKRWGPRVEFATQDEWR